MTERVAIPRTEAKLREARYFAEQLATTQSSTDVFSFNLSAFLSAGRSVTFVLAKEFSGYDEWFAKWRRGLSAGDSQLLDFMNRQRVQEVHTTGADIEIIDQELKVWRPPRFEIASTSRERAAWAFNTYYSTPLPLRAPTDEGGRHTVAASTDFTAFVETPRFTFDVVEGNTEDAVAVCGNYVAVLERLVHDVEERRT